MINSIYHKLYLSFLGIFVLTLLIVLGISVHFYGTSLRAGLQDAFLSQARFLRNQYVDACGPGASFPASEDECNRFLDRVSTLRQVRFWVLDAEGKTVFTDQGDSPSITQAERERAATGQEVGDIDTRGGPRAILPVIDGSGRVREFVVIGRALGRPGRMFRFPFFFSLIVAGIVAAIVVFPLSLRITRPVRELHQRGQEWAEGRLEKRANVMGKDEIAELAGVFNGMADNLQKMIQQRKEFLALISHEMKSPLTRLRISLELLSERSQNGQDASSLLKGMQDDISDSENLIEQLLFISRMEMMTMPNNPTQLDLGNLLKQVAEQSEPLARASGIRLNVTGTESPALVYADLDQLRRAISNVVDNALKFSPKGTTVDVKVARTGDGFQVEVADQGAGIEADELEKVFEPFYRGRMKEQKGGSGLGLFIAKRLLENVGGKIYARPNPPAGAVFIISLPQS